LILLQQWFSFCTFWYWFSKIISLLSK